MVKKNAYTIVYKQEGTSEDYNAIWTVGTYYNYHKALGHLVEDLAIKQREWLEPDNGYKIYEYNQFELIDNSTDTDYCWTIKLQGNKDPEDMVTLRWYLLSSYVEVEE